MVMLKRVIRPGTLEDIRTWILQSRSPGAQIAMDAHYFVLTVPDQGRVAAVGLRRLNWCMTEVKHLVVRPDERRKGYGSSIVRLVLERVRTPLAIATIRKDNLFSQDLFRKLGFFIACEFGLEGCPIRLVVRPISRERSSPSEVAASGNG
jgi:N-acetylglutamate synthase-like GNAT family acetyltransferase